MFRGVTDALWDLDHSLLRLGGDVRSKEQQILVDFGNRGAQQLASEAVDVARELNVMAVAQHYGAPTRLLDWSRNPEVALHFATVGRGSLDVDGAVWVVNPHVVHAQLPTPIRQHLDVARSDDPGVVPLATFLRVYKTLEEFDRNFVDGRFMPLMFIEPPSTDPRFRAQNALFSIVADAGCSVSRVLDMIDGASRKVIIPAAMKLELREQLDAQGYCERMYFPGLDGIGAYLTRVHRD